MSGYNRTSTADVVVQWLALMVLLLFLAGLAGLRGWLFYGDWRCGFAECRIEVNHE